MQSFCGLKRSMPCTDLNSMGSSISLKDLCASFDEPEFSSKDMLRSDKRQRMSPLCVIEEANDCSPATAALEAALALDAFDDDAEVDCLALFSLNEYSPKDFEDFTPCTPYGQCGSAVHTVHEATRVMSRMTFCG
jgi:hypothetical protein